MDREIVFLVLVLLISGPLLFVGGVVRFPPPRARSATRLERLRWTQLWLALTPVAVGVAAVGGWVLVEPEDSEAVPWALFAAATPCLVIWLRAGARAVWALTCVPDVKTAATVGILFPRVMIAKGFGNCLDDAALAAAVSHELAHARHRDPLRQWLAQFVVDLSWPAHPAQSRLRAWRRSLELARDEEARRIGAEGEDLAAAVMAAVRVTQSHPSATAAPLTGQGAALRQRVRRLLRPLPPVENQSLRVLPGLVLTGLAAATIAAAVLGATYGEAVVRLLVGGAS